MTIDNRNRQSEHYAPKEEPETATKASVAPAGYKGPATTEKEWETWYRQHCWELSNGTLREVTQAVAAAREDFADDMEGPNKYQVLHQLRGDVRALEDMMDHNTGLTRKAAYRVIASAIVLLQDSDL